MLVSVCFVFALQKRLKNEVAQKIPKKLPKICFIRRVRQQEEELWERSTPTRRPLGAARGYPRHLAASVLCPPSVSPLDYINPPTRNSVISTSFF